MPAAVAPLVYLPGWHSPQALQRLGPESAGPLRETRGGTRLLHPSNAKQGYFTDIPESRTPPSEHLRVVPLEHIFGSEPMSAAAPAVAQLVPAPYVLMNDVDALAQGTTSEQHVRVDFARLSLRLPLKRSERMPRGCIGVPFSLLRIAAGAEHQYARVSKP